MKRTTLLLGGILASVLLACLTAPCPAQAPAARQPQLWAVIVGINDYPDPAITDSKQAVKNANKLHAWFRETAGWDREHVLLLSDFGIRDLRPHQNPPTNILPTRANLEWAFQVWLKDKVKPGDLVVFYFAGQMAVGSPARSPEGRTEYYLLPIDALRANPEATGWVLDRALDQLVLRNEGKCRVMCWLGTNVSGLSATPPAGRPPGPAADRRPLASGASAQEWLRRLTRWPRVSTWLAADRDPAPGVEEPATLFTTTLMKGLGQPKQERNVAACLEALQQDPRLKRQGFQALGGVPPDVTLWSDQFGRILQPPRPEMVLQVGHADKITAIATSADGRLAITASMDSTIRVWSLEDRALHRIVTGHAVGVTSLALSRDGRWLASGGGRNEVLFHEVTRDYAKKTAFNPPHKARITQVVSLPSGHRFLSVDQSARAFLWDLDRSPLQPQPWLEGAECRSVTTAGDPEQGVVAALCGDGSVCVFGPTGEGKVVLENLPAAATAVAVAPDCQQVAIGLLDGRLAIRDLRSRRDAVQRVGAGRIGRLAYSRLGQLAVVHEDGLWLFPASPTRPEWLKLTGQPGAELVFSRDGRNLAYCTENAGELLVWGVDGESLPRPLLADKAAQACALTFNSDGGTVIWGCFDGAVRSCNLQAKEAGAASSWQFPAHRGKVQHLSAAPNRQFMLLVNELKQALLWDLKGRTCQLVPGRWSSGIFLDNDRMILASAPNAKNQPGQLVLVDRNTLTLHPSFFAVQEGKFQVPPPIRFQALALSHDGTRIAAAAGEAQRPLVCVWDTKSGRLARWISQVLDPVQTLSFSADTRLLATAGDSTEIAIWNLNPDEPPHELEQPLATLDDPGGAQVTCVAIRPGVLGQLVSGHKDGSVALWTYSDKQTPPVKQQLSQAMFEGAVKCLRFGSDGKSLAAAGDGTDFWFGQIAPKVVRNRAFDGFRPHHSEQINALEIAFDAGGGPPLLFSGSDDTTVRIWDLNAKKLLATFSAAFAADEKPREGAEPAGERDWVLFAPDGRFDSSVKGQALVRFRGQDRARLMEQFNSTLFTFQLGELLLTGTVPPEAQPLAEPPPLAIEPLEGQDPARAEGRLVISVGAANLHDFRLYQNDVPISLEGEELKAVSTGRVTARVHLVRGLNRFYAMAGKDGAYDARSPDIELAYNGPAESSRLHVIALGVGDYERRRLSFPGRDAERISQVLHDRGRDAAGEPGMRVVLTNGKVSAQGLDEAFHQVQKEVKNRPQDTVVLFLAGHTGVFDGDRFCLLLSRYPFPPEEPLLVAARDAAPALAEGARLKPEDLLPFASIAQNLMRLDALNRLVIVDACQAEAILSDPKVNAIQKWMEIGTRRARTSYLLAARRGEPALEVEPLSHGLFTYTLLLGMRAILPDQEPEEITRLKLPADADADGDGSLTTAELDAFVKRVMPTISAQFPALVASRRDATAKPQAAPRSTENLDQQLRLQTAETSFRLVPLRDPERTAQP